MNTPTVNSVATTDPIPESIFNYFRIIPTHSTQIPESSIKYPVSRKLV